MVAGKSQRRWLKVMGGVLLVAAAFGVVIVAANLRQQEKRDTPRPATSATVHQKSMSQETEATDALPLAELEEKETGEIKTPTFERILLSGETPTAVSTPSAKLGGSPTPTFDRTLMDGATPVGSDIISAEPGETLVLVTRFDNYAGDQVAYNVAGRLLEALEQEIEQARLENTRVTVWPETIGLRRYALQAGQAVSATLIIYGEYDLERVAVQFAHPTAEREFVKTGLLYKVSDVQALSVIINKDLPQQTRSLALLALGQIYISQDKIEQATYVLEQARQKLTNEPVDGQTWATLNFYLGIAYDHGQPPQLDAAIVAYTEALAAQPDLFAARLNRSAAYHLRQKPGDLELALADADEVVKLAPDWATAYERRGIAHALLGNYGQASADLEIAITQLEAQPVDGDQAEKLIQYQAWLEALQSGENPFTPEVLSELQKQ
jgi:tetratricopeptide (TPR) repeat protein